MDAEVREFHIKHGFPVDQDLTEFLEDDYLIDLAEQIHDLIVDNKLEEVARRAQEIGDERAHRAYLMLEELSEVIHALGENDEKELADGIADLHYVVAGTAVTYGLPGDALFAEVHKSNMTKKKRDFENDPRMRDKGKDYVPPDLEEVICKYRKEQTDANS